MLSIKCNIDKTDRTNRIVIGAILFIAAVMGMGRTFYMIGGIILLVEGLVGWCSIPYLLSKMKRT